jgi:hypothetical protein
VSATATSWDRIVLRWNAPPGDPVDGYIVDDGRLDGGFGVTGTCATLRHTSPDTTYCFRVSAHAKGAWSTETDSVCATTPEFPVEWTEQIGTTANDSLDALAVTSRGEVLLARHVGDTPETTDVFIEKYDPGGAVSWRLPLAATQRPASMGADDGGNVLVLGSDTASTQPFLMKISSGGAVQWVEAVYSWFGMPVSPAGLGVDGGGRSFLVSSARLVVMAYDADGHELWEQWNFGGDDTGAGIAVDAAGNVYVAGRRRAQFPTTQGYHWLVAKLDAAGNPLWTRDGVDAIDPLGVWGGDYGASAVAVDPEGLVHVAAYGAVPCWGPPDRPCPDAHSSFVLVFDPAGNISDDSGSYLMTGGTLTAIPRNSSWDGRLPLPGPSVISARRAQDSSGNLYVAGETSGAFPGFTNAGGSDVFVSKVSIAAVTYVAPTPSCP